MTQLETELRAALHERAARVHASRELLEADYRPRTRRLRAPHALVAAAGAITAVLMVAGGASNAFAGWTAKPTTPPHAQLAAAEAYCAQNVPFPNLPLQLSDTRGPFTFMIYSDGTSSNFCTIGPSFENASGWINQGPVTVPSGTLHIWAEHTSTDSSGQAYTHLIAWAADDVSAAVLTLDDGTQVTATVENGWAVAWWPGSQHLASAQLTTPAGTTTFTPNPCDLHKCGAPHGGGEGGG
jgi:hypothetical protein